MDQSHSNLTADDTPAPPESAGAGEPCPTPLSWQEVVKTFAESAVSRIVCTPGAETTVTEFGSGPPIVFLPSLAGTPLLFALTAWLLREEYRCILIEAPRFPQQPRPRDLIVQSVDTIALALEYASPDPAMVYASSWGGQLSLDLMDRYPQRVSAALLQGTWAKRTLTQAERLALHLGRHSPFVFRRAPAWTAAQIQNHRPWFPPFDETRFGFLLRETSQARMRDVSNRLLSSHVTDLRPRLAEISQPVLILRCEGEGKPIARAQEELETALPRARSEWMYHTGQYPYLTHPHRLVKVLKPFLMNPTADP